MLTIKAHFDGRKIVLDEPAALREGMRLLVTVLEQPEASRVEAPRLETPDTSGITVWRLIPHHEYRDEAVRWSLNNGRMAVGWGRIGEISAHRFGSEQDIVEAIIHQFKIGKHPLNNSASGGFSLWHFYSTMKKGDLVILRGEKLSRVVEVTGEYFFDAHNTPRPNDFYNHQRRIRATSIDPDVLWQRAGKMAHDGGSIYRTLIRCEKSLSSEDI